MQLACRHPEFKGPTRKIVEAVARGIFDNMDLPPAMKEVVRRGWDPKYDEVKNVGTH